MNVVLPILKYIGISVYLVGSFTIMAKGILCELQKVKENEILDKFGQMVDYLGKGIGLSRGKHFPVLFIDRVLFKIKMFSKQRIIKWLSTIIGLLLGAILWPIVVPAFLIWAYLDLKNTKK